MRWYRRIFCSLGESPPTSSVTTDPFASTTTSAPPGTAPATIRRAIGRSTSRATTWRSPRSSAFGSARPARTASAAGVTRSVTSWVASRSRVEVSSSSTTCTSRSPESGRNSTTSSMRPSSSGRSERRSTVITGSRAASTSSPATFSSAAARLDVMITTVSVNDVVRPARR